MNADQKLSSRMLVDQRDLVFLPQVIDRMFEDLAVADPDWTERPIKITVTPTTEDWLPGGREVRLLAMPHGWIPPTKITGDKP